MGRDPPETAWTAEEPSASSPIEIPTNRALPGRTVEDHVRPCGACHAGGRAFESRRSRPLRRSALVALPTFRDTLLGALEPNGDRRAEVVHAVDRAREGCALRSRADSRGRSACVLYASSTRASSAITRGAGGVEPEGQRPARDGAPGDTRKEPEVAGKKRPKSKAQTKKTPTKPKRPKKTSPWSEFPRRSPQTHQLAGAAASAGRVLWAR
jgi:hypothetical protein